MRHLCDTNVWRALALSGHSHQPLAAAWFQSLGAGDTAEFCRASQTSFLRLLTTPAIVGPHTLSNDDALDWQVKRDGALRGIVEVTRDD